MTDLEKAQILNNKVIEIKKEYPDRKLRWHIKRIANFYQVQLLLRDLSGEDTIGYSKYVQKTHPLYPRHQIIVVEKNLRPSKRLVVALYLIANHLINDELQTKNNYIVKNIPRDKGSSDNSSSDTLCRMFVSDVALDTNELETIIRKAKQIKGGRRHV